jgi:hypothetical protein
MRVILTVLLAMAALVVPTAAASAATTVKVLQLNICNSGVAGCYTGRALSKAVCVVGLVKQH